MALIKDNISIIRCKYCNSSNVIKYGTYKGVQRYFTEKLDSMIAPSVGVIRG